jgi:hypothetical protein
MKTPAKSLELSSKEEIKTNEIEASLIYEFMESFRKHSGYYPTVITREAIVENKEGIKLLTLNELNQYFNPFLPKIYNKTTNLDTKLRNRVIVELRFMFCYIARSMRFTLTDIGRFLKRDHTTIIHALNMFHNLYQTDESFRFKYTTIINSIKENQHESQSLDDIDKTRD